jgi:hypothetical protein
MAKEKDDSPKYGVSDFAKKMGIKGSSARVSLRKHNIKKLGKVYGWNTLSDLESVVKKCQEGKPASKKDKKAAAKKKPAKKASRKAASEGAGASA